MRKLGFAAVAKSKRDKAYRRDYPEKVEAGRILNDAVHSGKIKRSVFCEGCGLPKKVQGYHEDYDKPLGVEWLCKLCHKAEHKSHRGPSMKQKLSDRQVEAYKLCSGDFEGLPTADAAVLMNITPQAVNRLLRRAEVACPQLFPLLTKQEVDVKALLAIGWSKQEIADQLQVCLSRVRQIIVAINDKQGTVRLPPVKIVRYQSFMDSQIKERF